VEENKVTTQRHLGISLDYCPSASRSACYDKQLVKTVLHALNVFCVVPMELLPQLETQRYNGAKVVYVLGSWLNNFVIKITSPH